MKIFIDNLEYSIIEILINIGLIRKKYTALEFYHAFRNSLVILDKYHFALRTTQQLSDFFSITK